MKNYHTPVLLNESLEGLNIKPDGTYIDCTLGEAGHSFEIYKKLSNKGILISIDRDQNAIDFVSNTYEKELKKGNWRLVKSNFSNLKALNKKADGILMDLGLSSRQIDIQERGFTYMKDEAPLDMRMDQDLSVTAKDLLKVLTEKELELLFRKYGEERFARSIAKEIKKRGNIEKVGDLTSLIYKVVPATSRKDSHHPARRVFQALRIAVNDELNSLKQGLDEAFEILNSKGRLCVITFHSLEDRITKDFFKLKIEEGSAQEVGQLILPTEKEVQDNSRSRSAKLRILEKK